jgi:hypothetical protein
MVSVSREDNQSRHHVGVIQGREEKYDGEKRSVESRVIRVKGDVCCRLFPLLLCATGLNELATLGSKWEDQQGGEEIACPEGKRGALCKQRCFVIQRREEVAISTKINIRPANMKRGYGWSDRPGGVVILSSQSQKRPAQ